MYVIGTEFSTVRTSVSCAAGCRDAATERPDREQRIREVALGRRYNSFVHRLAIREDEVREAQVAIGRMSYLWQVVLLAAVYFAVAKLSLTVAIQPGYATAVWSPSGIALVAALLCGRRIWPAI
jgi:hypothetical protein